MKTVRSNGCIAIPSKWMILFHIGVLMAMSAGAATIWNGPAITFTQVSGSDSVDQLAPDVGLTRGATQGLYNAVSESGYTHNFSPADTAWAFGELADYATLTYTDWEDMFGGAQGGGPPSTVGKDCVVHLISDDIYLSVKMISWGGSSGGFSYVRSTAPVSPPAFQSITISTSNTVTLTWSATVGQAYQFQYSTNLVSTNWTNLGGSIMATNVAMNTTDTNVITGSAGRFYRISTP
jgi:hypothetical protein